MYLSELSTDSIAGRTVNAQVRAFRYDVLAEKHRNPVGLDEKLTLAVNDVAAFPEGLHLVVQPLWNSHISAVLPKLAVVPGRRLVMQDNEVTYLFKRLADLRVIVVAVYGAELAVGKAFDELYDGSLDQVVRSIRAAR